MSEHDDLCKWNIEGRDVSIQCWKCGKEIMPTEVERRLNALELLIRATEGGFAYINHNEEGLVIILKEYGDAILDVLDMLGSGDG